MNIRNKITVYFASVTLIISAIAFLLIYFLSSANREEEFQMRQKEKISTTLKLLSKIKEVDNSLIEAVDLLTIHDLYDEKLLLFNHNKELIYSSVDDVPVHFSKEILAQLSSKNEWVETKDGLYDVVGTQIESHGKIYYGISKAFDTFGYSKLRFLKYILIAAFIMMSVIVVVVSYFLSKKITGSLAKVTKRINEYNFEERYTPIDLTGSKDEISLLAQQFNTLMKRMNEAFSFQKHAVHHISHELKTPVSILVSNFEKIENVQDPEKIKTLIRQQKEDTKSLSEIINSLLEIAKTESGGILKQDRFRIDELLFDVAGELKNLYPECHFSITYASPDITEQQLTVIANARLIKSSLTNLMQNCIQYSQDGQATLILNAMDGIIQINFENNGLPISENDRQYLFRHFFRGENSKGKRGFGLGLVLVHRVITLHGGTVFYTTEKQANRFTITLPL